MKYRSICATFVTALLCIVLCSCAANPYLNAEFDIPEDILDSVDIVSYVRTTYDIDDSYSVVKYTAALNAQHRGRWDIMFMENNKEHPNFIFVTVDTESHTSFDYHTAWYDSKLKKEHTLDSCISSERAISIAAEYVPTSTFTNIDLFMANEPEQEAPCWIVRLDNNPIVVDAVSGEIYPYRD